MYFSDEHARWQSGTATHLLTRLMKWSSGTGTSQTNTSGHDWQSRCTVKKCQSHGQKKWFKNLHQCSSLQKWAGQWQRGPFGNAKHKIEKIWGSHVDTEPTVWGLDAQVWNLLWTNKDAMKEGIPTLKQAGFESVEDLLRIAVGYSSKAYQDLPPQLRLSATSNGEQRVRMRVPNQRKDSTAPPNRESLDPNAVA